MKLGLVLQQSPNAGSLLRSCYHLCVGALDAGHKVAVFCRGEGVYAALENQVMAESEAPVGSVQNWWTALTLRGLDLLVSDHCAESRGLNDADLFVDGVRFVDLERMGQALAKCDKVVSL